MKDDGKEVVTTGPHTDFLAQLSEAHTAGYLQAFAIACVANAIESFAVEYAASQEAMREKVGELKEMMLGKLEEAKIDFPEDAMFGKEDEHKPPEEEK